MPFFGYLSEHARKSSHDSSSPHNHPNTRTPEHRRSRELPRTTCNRRPVHERQKRVICRLAAPGIGILDLGLPHASGVGRECFVFRETRIVPRARREARPHVRRERATTLGGICGDAFPPRFENENPLMSMACPRTLASALPPSPERAALVCGRQSLRRAYPPGRQRRNSRTRSWETVRGRTMKLHSAAARASGNRQIGPAWGGGGRGGRCEARASAPHPSAQTFSSTGRGAVRNRSDKQDTSQVLYCKG